MIAYYTVYGPSGWRVVRTEIVRSSPRHVVITGLYGPRRVNHASLYPHAVDVTALPGWSYVHRQHDPVEVRPSSSHHVRVRIATHDIEELHEQLVCDPSILVYQIDP